MKSIRIGIGQECPTDIGKGNNSLILGDTNNGRTPQRTPSSPPAPGLA
jgi:hypothetical protein